MNPVFLNWKIPSEQNNVKDIHCDGRNFYTAVVPANDNSLKQNNVNKNADNLGEQKYYSGGNIITLSAHTAVVTAASNINHGLH